MGIQENIKKVQEHIQTIQKRCESSHKIELIAVSKQKSIEEIKRAIEAGQKIFGENRIQEAQNKILQIQKPGVQWHAIGPIQKNKAKKAVELFDVIHSVDQYETAHLLDRYCQEKKKILPIFIQVNTTEEPQKSGVHPSSLKRILEEISSLKQLQIQGLMTLGPFTRNPIPIRKAFRLLYELKEKMRIDFAHLHYLSMGMSMDYEIAIEEGATHIRLGTILFGKREN